jgi:hypothetical protein
MIEDPSRPTHELTDASPGAVGAIAAALVVLVAVGIGAGIGTVRHEAEGTPLPAPATSFSRGAVYRPDVERSWEQCARDSAARLAGYAWLDRRTGRVRIPLERAMDLVAEESKGGGK